MESGRSGGEKRVPGASIAAKDQDPDLQDADAGLARPEVCLSVGSRVPSNNTIFPIMWYYAEGDCRGCIL